MQDGEVQELLSPPTDREKELLAIIYGNHAAMSLGARTESSSHTQTKTKPKTQLPTSFFILTLDPVRVEVAEQWSQVWGIKLSADKAFQSSQGQNLTISQALAVWVLCVSDGKGESSSPVQ